MARRQNKTIREDGAAANVYDMEIARLLLLYHRKCDFRHRMAYEMRILFPDLGHRRTVLWQMAKKLQPMTVESPLTTLDSTWTLSTENWNWFWDRCRHFAWPFIPPVGLLNIFLAPAIVIVSGISPKRLNDFVSLERIDNRNQVEWLSWSTSILLLIS